MPGAVRFFRQYWECELRPLGYGGFNVSDIYQTMAEFLHNPFSIALVARRGEILVGAISGYWTHWWLDRKERVFYENIWIASERGVGLRLLRALEEELLRRGINFCVMGHMFGPGSERTRRIYEHSGYRALEAHYFKKIGKENLDV